jgi:GxxExxY protein
MGFLELVCENALAHEPCKAGLAVRPQHGVVVTHDGIAVGVYEVALMIEGAMLAEQKALRASNEVHHAQCRNGLRATGLFLSFGNPRLAIKRFVLGP